MILLQVTTFTVLICVVSASPISYQYVSFTRNGRTKPGSPSRTSRSFGFSRTENHFWSNDDIIPHTSSLTFEENRGHITPDFSNGLDYPDPLLLTGRAARRTAQFLYRKPLFFGDINHVELLERKQDERIANGLAGNNLGSLRPRWPFYRFKEPFYSNRYFK